jgi:heme/copper-type cytochrome/quinol oxidase subunit 3
MIPLPPRFTEDLRALPTHAFSHRSLTWWGIMGFMLIEGAAFGLAIAAYFFLMANEQRWPPDAVNPPGLWAGTIFTLIAVASEVPNTWLKKAAERYDRGAVQLGLFVMVAIGVVLLIVRSFEFMSLNISWYDNAYGSILWALLLMHFVHVATDWIDTAVLAALMLTPHGREGRRFVDVSENSLYWRFVWLSWLPLYLLIYWLPRIVH